MDVVHFTYKFSRHNFVSNPCRLRQFKSQKGKIGPKKQSIIAKTSSASSHAPHENPNSEKKAAETFRTLYPRVSSHQVGQLQVSERHKLYFEVFGNPNGIPALFLHGGPGAGCYENHARFFDPQQFRIVLFDQRGCGKSEPRGSLLENTTQDLVEDIEKLRNHLGVKKWVILGGSWGTTLGLVYSETYPESVLCLILRGVCLLREEEIDWFYKRGASYLFPFNWEAMNSSLFEEERSNLVKSFYKRLTSADPAVRDKAASLWLRWESALSSFQETSGVLSWDGESYTMGGVPINTQLAKSASGEVSAAIQSATESDPPALEIEGSVSSFTVQARLECHYFYNNGFIRENQILEEIDKIRKIPTTIVHGRFDFVCPVKNAFDLHRAFPEAKMRIVPSAGHSMYEKGIVHELIEATDRALTVNPE